jgi:quercetin dioxygenase-like cupin family protein
MISRTLFLSVGFAITALAGIAAAQAPATPAPPAGFKRTELGRHDISNPNHEEVLARADLSPGVSAPKHTHPGEEVGYVLVGEVTVEIEGAAPVKLKAGDNFFVPANTPHLARNLSKAPASILSTYILEKGKPLATPVAAPAK